MDVFAQNKFSHYVSHAAVDAQFNEKTNQLQRTCNEVTEMKNKERCNLLWPKDADDESKGASLYNACETYCTWYKTGNTDQM